MGRRQGVGRFVITDPMDSALVTWANSPVWPSEDDPYAVERLAAYVYVWHSGTLGRSPHWPTEDVEVTERYKDVARYLLRCLDDTDIGVRA